jgi:hypothetical protein
LAKAQKPQRIAADVGVVDVAVDDVGDRLAARPRAQAIGGGDDGLEIRAVGM